MSNGWPAIGANATRQIIPVPSATPICQGLNSSSSFLYLLYRKNATPTGAANKKKIRYPYHQGPTAETVAAVTGSDVKFDEGVKTKLTLLTDALLIEPPRATTTME